MKPAALKDAAFLEDVRRARDNRDALHIWWLGQSGFLLAWNGHYLLFDPYLSDSLTEKYAATDKPHIRMTERVIDPARLDFIDVVTSSHNHTDHLDKATLLPLMGANPEMKLVIPEANRAFVADRLECQPDWPIGLDAAESKQIGPFSIAAVPAAHETFDQDQHGRHRYLGYVAKLGPWTVYHSGDTIRYEGMEDWLRPFPIDVALLPINGSRPERRVAGNLGGPQAARLARDIGAGTVIPCHYDMFAFNTETPQSFVEACEALGQQYAVIANGGRWSAAPR